MPDHNLTYDDLRRIVELIKSSEQFSEFRLKVGEIEIELRRRREARSPAPVDARAIMAESTPPPLPGPVASRAVAYEGAAWPEHCIAIRSPMVGTFYRAPEPEAPPFVHVGQKVEPGTTVCIIEVMKLMNSIPAGAHGVVAQVLVDDAAPVEAGQALIVLRLE